MPNYGFNRGLNEVQCHKCGGTICLDTPGNEDINLENPLCVQCMAQKGGGNDPETQTEEE